MTKPPPTTSTPAASPASADAEQARCPSDDKALGTSVAGVLRNIPAGKRRTLRVVMTLQGRSPSLTFGGTLQSGLPKPLAIQSELPLHHLRWVLLEMDRCTLRV